MRRSKAAASMRRSNAASQSNAAPVAGAWKAATNTLTRRSGDYCTARGYSRALREHQLGSPSGLSHPGGAVQALDADSRWWGGALTEVRLRAQL